MDFLIGLSFVMVACGLVATIMLIGEAVLKAIEAARRAKRTRAIIAARRAQRTAPRRRPRIVIATVDTRDNG